ncbi:MAG TPA: transporter substrate-binding domain-containing protein [Paucimonas sp.]|nr:transporter substrate-binding domain-containing protein [Paucimonas sp.]
MKITCLAMGLLFSVASPLVAAESLVIGAEDDWYPYAGTVDTKPKGMAVDIVREAFKKAGIDVQFQSMPYARCMEEAKASKIFGCFDAARNSVLENQYLWHAKPLFKAKILIYAKADSTEKGLTAKSLEGMDVAVTQDYEYGEAFDSNPKIKRVVSKHDVQGFRKLLNGQVKYMVAYEKVANHLFAHHKAEMGDKFKPVGSTAEVGLYIAIGKNFPNAAKYIERFNQGFDGIVKDGKYKAIENEWK